MRRFNFRLESILRHRKLLEDRERTVLSQARTELKVETDHHEDLEKRRQSTIETIVDASSGQIDPLDLDVGRRYLERIGTEIARSEQRLVTLDHAVKTQTRVVVEASKKTKVLDTLKSRKRKEHQVEADKAEQKGVDEIVVIRHVHREPD